MSRRFLALGAALASILLLGTGLAAQADQAFPLPLPSGTPSVSPTDGSTPTPNPTPAPVRPGAPTGLVYGIDAVDAISFTWQAPLKDGGSPIIDYRVEYIFDDFGGTLRWAHEPSTATGVTITNLPLQLGLTVSIRTVTAAGVSLPTRVHLVTPNPDGSVEVPKVALKQASFLKSSWNTRSSGKYGYYVGVNCANWASQSLLKRGYKQTSTWHGRLSPTRGATKAWISSTALQKFMISSGRAVELTDAQRELVKVGDLVQFDWWNKGQKEHTGVVSAIVPTSSGLRIYYASHTAHGLYWSVDRSIQVSHPGATVTYLSLR